MTPTKYQVYGERCCGTHFITKLLERNITNATFTEEFGFKHWFPNPFLELPNDTLVIHVRRNLPDSLRSLHRQPWHVDDGLKDLPFTDFLRKKWRCVWNEDVWQLTKKDPRWGQEMMHERNPLTGFPYQNVIALRTAKDLHWTHLGSRAQHFISLDYESVLADPLASLQNLSAQYNLELRDDFVPVDSYKGLEGGAFRPTKYPDISTSDSELIAKVTLAETQRTLAELEIFNHFLQTTIPLSLNSSS